MYNTSDEYKALVSKNDLTTAKIAGKITLLNGKVIEINEDNVAADSLSIDWACVSGSSLSIGTAIKGELDMSFYIELANYYDLIGAEIKVSYFLNDEEIPLGIYTIAEPSRKGRLISVSAFDNMSKIDFSLGNNGTNGSPYSVLSWISKNTGVKLANTQEEIEAMPNGKEIINISNNVFSSYVEALAEVAAVLCGFATINRFGELEIRQYKEKSGLLIMPDQIVSASVSDYISQYTEMVSKIDSVTYTNTTGDGKGLTYYLESNVIRGTSSAVNTMLRNIINKLSDLKYTPADISTFGDPSIDLGDMITIKADGIYVIKDIDIVVTSLNWSFLSSSSLKSTGENPYLQSATTSTSAGSSTAANAKNNSTYIATFENAESYTINDTETIISSIDYTNGENDTLIINGQCEIEVTLAGNFEIHYYVDGVKNTFAPVQYLTEGKHILNFSCWFNLEESNYLFSVQIGITGTGEGTISADKIRSYVLGTTLAAGKFYTNNVFEETIPIQTFKNDIYPAGYEKEDEENEL